LPPTHFPPPAKGPPHAFPPLEKGGARGGSLAGRKIPPASSKYLKRQDTKNAKGDLAAPPFPRGADRPGAALRGGGPYPLECVPLRFARGSH
jgi:hypothetical protein